MQHFLKTMVEAASLRLAVAGDGNSVVDVPARPNYIYARRGSADGNVFECHVNVVHPNHGDSFYYHSENPLHPGGERLVFWLRDASDPTRPAPVVGSVNTLALLTDDADIALTDDTDAELLEG